MCRHNIGSFKVQCHIAIEKSNVHTWTHRNFLHVRFESHDGTIDWAPSIVHPLSDRGLCHSWWSFHSGWHAGRNDISLCPSSAKENRSRKSVLIGSIKLWKLHITEYQNLCNKLYCSPLSINSLLHCTLWIGVTHFSKLHYVSLVYNCTKAIYNITLCYG